MFDICELAYCNDLNHRYLEGVRRRENLGHCPATARLVLLQRQLTLLKRDWRGKTVIQEILIFLSF